MNLPIRSEWEEFGFNVPDELCSQPLKDKIIKSLLSLNDNQRSHLLYALVGWLQYDAKKGSCIASKALHFILKTSEMEKEKLPFTRPTQEN